MLTITVTAWNNDKGLKELKEFEKILRGSYEIICKSRYGGMCSADSYSTSSNDLAVKAYSTAVNDYITDQYVVSVTV